MSTIQSERGCQDENEPQACRQWGHSYRQPTNEVPAGRGGLMGKVRNSQGHQGHRWLSAVRLHAGYSAGSHLARQVRASPGRTTAGDSTVLPSRLPVTVAGRASIFSPWLSYLALNLQN